MSFKLTPKQKEALKILSSDATHILLYGGSRSGKTFLLVRAVVIRAMASDESSHVILRYRFNQAKTKIGLGTFPKVMSLCFPDIEYGIDKTDWYFTLPNGSTIWLGGLDEKERTEKILGEEHSTIYLNECSQIPYSSRNLALTRLAQKTTFTYANGETKELRLKMYYDCVSGDTVLPGQKKDIATLALENKPILALTSYGWVWASPPWENGTGKLYTVITESGKQLKVTASHRFWTKQGWKRLKNITTGQKILCTDEHQYPDDVLNAGSLKQIVRDSQENYYKYHRQHDGQSHPVVNFCQDYLAFASYAMGHNLCACCHDAQDCHTGHQHQQATQRNHHSQEFHALLSRMFSGQPFCKEGHGDLPICGLSRQKYLFYQRFHESLGHLQSDIESCFAEFLSLYFFYCSGAFYSPFSTCKPVLLRNQLRQQAHDQSCPDYTETPIVDGLQSFSFDTPLMDNCHYEKVVAISQSTTAAFYTIEVPLVKHYIANGFINHNCNPPTIAHWSYKLFFDHTEPNSKQLLDKSLFANMQMNPVDNLENLADNYIGTLNQLPARQKVRFLEGNFSSLGGDYLWNIEGLEKWRTFKDIPDMQRIVVAIDPSGAENDDEDAVGDAIGIIVAGLGTDGNGYVLEDLTIKASPKTWGEIAVQAYDRHKADCIVAEGNYGGSMVEYVIQTARPRTPYKKVTATRGKVVRAEPISSLAESGKIRHAGNFNELEDELCSFTSRGYMGDESPNRADAYVWAFTELFDQIVTEPYEESPVYNAYTGGATGWMGI